MSVSLTIDGVERSGVVDFTSLRRSNRINETADQLTSKVKRGGGKTYTPGAGDEVILTVNGTREFGGVIVRIQDTLLAPNFIEYEVKCKDYTHTFDRELITETYQNTTVEAIINDIVSNNTTGFTTNNVVANVAVGKISFNRLSPSQCLKKLASKANFSWFIDYYKDVHFFAKNQEDAPFNLTDDENDKDYAKYIYKSLTNQSDLTQLRNVILVEGGEKEGAEREITRDGSEASDEGVLDLQYSYSEKPTVTVDSGSGAVAQTVGVDYLDDDEDFDALWNYNEKYLRFTDGSIPASGDVIVITGTPLIPIIVNVPNNNSVAEYGRFKHAIKDHTIRSEDEAIDRAIAEIEAYGDSIIEGSFETYEPGLRAGQRLTITDSFRNMDEDVLIQSVDMQPVTPDGSRLIHKVKYATYKTMGILDFLQNQLMDEEISEQEVENLLEFVKVQDSFGASTEDDPTFTASTPPYHWSPVDTGQSFKWNFGSWS